MAKSRAKRKRTPKHVLKLPDLEQSKSAVLHSLTSQSSQRTYDHAIREFIEWHCSEPRLGFNKTVVTRYRISLEQHNYASTTINLGLAAVRRLAYEAAVCGLLSADLAAGIRRVKGAKRLGAPVGNWLRAEPYASSNGSPPRNSCFARHLNQTGTQHEALSTSSAFERASAPTRILLFIRPKPRGRQSLQPPHQTSASHAAVPSGLQAIGSYPTQSVPDPSAPAQTDSKCIAFHEGGFLQVAVSEAPHPGACNCAMSCAGALQIQH